MLLDLRAPLALKLLLRPRLYTNFTLSFTCNLMCVMTIKPKFNKFCSLYNVRLLYRVVQKNGYPVLFFR